jgi:hypothetical protein
LTTTVPNPPIPNLPTPGQRRLLDAEFGEVARALTAVAAGIDAAPRPDLALMAGAVSGCVRVTGLLAALTGTLGEHAREPESVGLLDVAADLATMRSLLHRATLVAAPAVADLRRYQVHSVR